MLDATTFNLAWGQCDESMKAQLKQHPNFKVANNTSSIIKLLVIVDKVCKNSKFGNSRDVIYWALTQNRKVLSYIQIPQKETGIWLKDLTDLYNTQALLAVSMPCGNTIMKDVLKDKVGPGTTMSHYYNPINSNKVAEWDPEYKNQVLTRLISMLADRKPMCAPMDELMSQGQSNTFNVTINTMPGVVMTKVKKKRGNDARKSAPNNINDDESIKKTRAKYYYI